jgi:transposase-like protein
MSKQIIKIKIVNPKHLRDMKFCKGCDGVKETGEFYKTGHISTITSKDLFQSLCKECHNNTRKKYVINPVVNKYIKKGRGPSGFQLLPKDTKDKIKYDIFIKKSYKSIAKEYGISYHTLLSWKRKNIIPEHVEVVEVVEVAEVAEVVKDEIDYNDRCSGCNRHNDFCRCGTESPFY